jgi:hypothetical protein
MFTITRVSLATMVLGIGLVLGGCASPIDEPLADRSETSAPTGQTSSAVTPEGMGGEPAGGAEGAAPAMPTFPMPLFGSTATAQPVIMQSSRPGGSSIFDPIFDLFFRRFVPMTLPQPALATSPFTWPAPLPFGVEPTVLAPGACGFEGCP